MDGAAEPLDAAITPCAFRASGFCAARTSRLGADGLECRHSRSRRCRRGHAMQAILFTNGHIWDGISDARYEAELLVRGERIAAVSRKTGEFSGLDAQRIDARGATLIPGLVD